MSDLASTCHNTQNFVSIANSIYQKFEKFRFSNFDVKIFVKKTKNKKQEMQVCYPQKIANLFSCFFILSVF